MSLPLVRTALALIPLGFGAAPLAAQCELGEQQKLAGSAATQFDQFGGSVAISGTRAVVGADGEDSVAAFAGGVYVFEQGVGGWSETQLLQATGQASGDRFGRSLALEGDVLVASAPFLGLGAAVVFRDSGAGFVEEVALTASDGGSSQFFASDVALSGDRVAVGARQATGGSALTGAVYLYEYDAGSGSWSETHKVSAADGLAFDQFGERVLLQGDRLVVGAPDASTGSSSENGAVYVFEYDVGSDSWLLDDKLEASDGSDDDHFGGSLAMDGDQLLVAATLYDDTHINQGAVYRFERSGTWSELERFVAGDALSSSQFGRSLAIDGDTILVGANLSSAYVLRYGRQRKLTGSDSSLSDGFGVGLALQGDRAIIGSPADDDGGLDSGSAYVFVIPELQLAASAESFAAGDPIAFELCGGQSGGLHLLVATHVNGSFFFLKILFASFDGDGHWSFGPVNTPPGLSGLDVTMQSFGFAASGKVAGSNSLVLQFL